MVSIETELQVGTGFCIGGAGLKLTELIPYTLRIEDNVPRQDAPSGLQMVLEISRVITQRCHAQGFMDILHVCEEDLAAARAQGAWCKREACLLHYLSKLVTMCYNVAFSGATSTICRTWNS